MISADLRAFRERAARAVAEADCECAADDVDRHRRLAHARRRQFGCYTEKTGAIQRQPVAQADPQIARTQQPRLRVDPSGGCHIAVESPLCPEGFLRRLENAPLWIEALRRPPSVVLRTAF